jgi:integration host factor subunit beta
MLKSELIMRLAEKIPHLPVRTINNGVNHLIQLMSDALAESQRIEIRGFGSFSTKHRLARDAHNPKTGEKMQTTEKFSPHFKPGKDLRDRINTSRNTQALHEEESAE